VSRTGSAARSCALVLVVAVSFPGCREPEPPAGLRFGLANAPVTLDPRLATDAASSRINRLLHRALVRFDAELRPRPDLARWHTLDDRHYRFELIAPAARFADGSALTARDVVATYRSVLAEDSRSPHRGSLANVERAFRSLKTMDLKVRPIHHRLEDRVRAHIFICMLTCGVSHFFGPKFYGHGSHG